MKKSQSTIEPQPRLLKFDFTAKLLSKKRDIEMSGTIAKTDWQTKYLRTTQEAAWAYVRGLLMFAGKWRCTVNDEQRLIDVVVFEGGEIFRHDVKETATTRIP